MRTPCAVVIVLALLLATTGTVTAQMNKEAVPAVFVTGMVTDQTATEDEGTVVYEQTVEWSDPRLPPMLRAEGAWYIYGDVPPELENEETEAIEDYLVMVTEVNVLLDSPEGSWLGSGRAIEQGVGPDPDGHYSYYVLEGDGAYAGTHALLRGAPGHDADGPWDELYEGWIVESELPLLPSE